MNCVRCTVIILAVFAIATAVRNSEQPEKYKTVSYQDFRCPFGWTMFERKCFHLFEELRTWYEADQMCKSKGADLAILNSRKLNDMAINMTKSRSMFIWIGLTDLEFEGTFKWNDGTALMYNDWGSVEPNNRGTNFQTNADCVLLHSHNNDGEWKDKNCEETLFYMCFRNATSGTTTTFVSTAIVTTQPKPTETTKQETVSKQLDALTNQANGGNLTAAEATNVGESAINAMQDIFNSPTSDDTDKMDITEKAENLFVVLSESVKVGESLVISKDNIVAELHHLSSPEELEGLTFKAPGYDATNSTPPSLTFEVDRKMNNKDLTDVNVAVIYYDRKIFGDSNGGDKVEIVHDDKSDVTMVSGVISATASSARNEIPVMVDFTLPKDNKGTKIPDKSDVIRKAICAFWDVEARAWSTDGCQVVSGVDEFSSETTCSCSHTTNFAVLMQVSDVPIDDKHHAVLEWITRIGCSISLAGLFISLGVYLYFEDLRKSERNLIHINLMASLIVVQLLFLLGIERTENKEICTAIAICLHFFLMAVFSWMLVEGIYLHFKLLRRTAVNKSKLPYYMLIGWGIPVVTVAFTAGFGLSGYGSEKSCWLDTANGHIWAFVGPALAIIMVNIITLFFVVKLIFQRSSRRKNESQHAVAKQTKSNNISYKPTTTAVKGAFILLPILGLTWLFGILSVGRASTIVFQYLFVIFNSLQGLSIFLVYCVLNSEVQNAWKRQRDRKKRTSLMTSLSKEMKKGPSSSSGQSAPLKSTVVTKEFV